jgi:glycosyltransferase involved in cell wall biosynthesis
MRILMLSHGYPPVVSGVTLVVRKVARAMVERGHQVWVITASDRGAPYEAEDEGVRLIRVRSGTNPFWSEGRLPLLSHERLVKIVNQVRPDVINTHDSALLSWQLTHLERERIAVPEVLTAHFLPRFVTFYANVGERVERVLEDITWEVVLRVINDFDHVVFPTHTQQQLFRQEGLEAPSVVISNGVDIQRFCPGEPDPEVERRYRLPARPRVLFVGRMARDKKIELVIRALAAVEGANLLLAGRGDHQEHLRDLAKELGVAARVHFLGYVPDTDLPDLYRAADLFVIAAEVEVQSIPTLEAASTGLPIIAANAAALPELVKDGVNGYLVPPDDEQAFAAALRRILDSGIRRAEFGRASLVIAAQHANERTLAAYEQLYRSVADGVRREPVLGDGRS